MRLVLTVRNGHREGPDLDALLDADLSSPLLEVVRAALELGGEQIHPSFSVHVPVWVDGMPVDLARGTVRSAGLRPGGLLELHAGTAPARDAPSGVAEVRVVNGQGAGRVHRMAPGETVVGCGAPGLSLPDVRVPADGLRLVASVNGQVEVTPGEGALVELEGEPVEGTRPWPQRSCLVVGDTVLELCRPAAPDGEVAVGADHPGLDFNRPPRLLALERVVRFTVPAAPVEPRRRSFPWVMVASPALIAVPMAVIFRSYAYLAFGLFSPVMMVANLVSERRSGVREYRERLAEWTARRDATTLRIEAALVEERQARRALQPDPATVLLAALGPTRRLWERRWSDPDALRLRVGLAEQAAEVVVDDRSGEPVGDGAVRSLWNVPVGVDLRRAGVLGVAGDVEVVAAELRWLVAQCAALHSPRDLRLVLVSTAERASRWRWVRWLPHLRDEVDPATVLVGLDQQTVGRRVAELARLVETRRASAAGTGGAGTPAPDVVVVLDGARRLRALPGVLRVLREGPAVGVYAICVEDEVQALPAECMAVLECGSDRVTLRRTRADQVVGIRPDLVEVAWVERVARAVSPLQDVSPVEEAGGLPAGVRLLECLDLDPPTAQAVRAWWGKGPTTEVVLGAGFDGPFSLDLRRDGPHALIAGTTGAGKSEFLQSLVAALAVANRADELTFVLVDYKGGSAFKDCARLPHTVGMVTDLDGYLVGRALTSLGAELRRREHLLADAGAKDLEDYLALRRRDPDLAPLPRLVLVIDEFAGMVAELPDFVSGLVGLAQRGRSLGIHLVLATQRPSGVVSPEIRANTNLRIALRVTDDAESRDVIESPEAARISRANPGRGYARTGHSTLLPFQAGRVGGARPAGTGRPASEQPAAQLWPLPWAAAGQPAPQRALERVAATDEGDTDLSDLVRAPPGRCADAAEPLASAAALSRHRSRAVRFRRRGAAAVGGLGAGGPPGAAGAGRAPVPARRRRSPVRDRWATQWPLDRSADPGGGAG